jgi:hypothetical protein
MALPGSRNEPPFGEYCSEMSNESERLWKRARECRVLAEATRDPHQQKMLRDRAAEFEEEARVAEKDSPDPA